MPKAETQTSTRERDPDGRKERILTAAEEVFARHGFADSSVREISRLADVNVASINYYFGSKEGLYREVLVNSHRQLIEQQEPPPPSDDPEESLQNWIHYCLTFVLLKKPAHPVLGRLMAFEMRQPTAALEELVRLVIKPRFTELTKVVSAVAGKNRTAKEVEMAAHQIIGMCVHFEHSRQVVKHLGFPVPENEADICHLARSISSMVLNGLRSPLLGQETAPASAAKSAPAAKPARSKKSPRP